MIGVVRVTVPVVVIVCPLEIGPMGERPHWLGTRALANTFRFFAPDPPGAVAIVADGPNVPALVFDVGSVAVVVEAWLVTVDGVVAVGPAAVVWAVADGGALAGLAGALAGLAGALPGVAGALTGLAGASVVDGLEMVITGLCDTAVVVVLVSADLTALAGFTGVVVVVEATGKVVVTGSVVTTGGGVVGATVVVVPEPLGLAAAEAWVAPRTAITATAPVAIRPVTRTDLKLGRRPTHWRTCIVRISARIVTICSDLEGSSHRQDEGPHPRSWESEPLGGVARSHLGRPGPSRAPTSPRYCRPRVSATWWSSARKSGWAMSARA